MILQRLEYALNYFKIAFSNIRSNMSENLFAFSIMSFSFFIMLFLLLFYINIYNYMSSFQETSSMIILFKKGSGNADLINYIKRIKGVKSLKYYEGKPALKSLEEKNPAIKKKLEDISAAAANAGVSPAARKNQGSMKASSNPGKGLASQGPSPNEGEKAGLLKSSPTTEAQISPVLIMPDMTGTNSGIDYNKFGYIKINFRKNFLNRLYLSDTYLKLKLKKGVDYVYYDKILRDKAIEFLFFVRVMGLIIFAFLFLLATFIYYSAIKLVILKKQDEIDILRLIGATNGYIRAPMFLESLFGGVLSFIAALIFLFAIFNAFMYYRFNDFLAYFHVKIIFLNYREIFTVFSLAVISSIVGTFLSSKKFFYNSEE